MEESQVEARETPRRHVTYAVSLVALATAYVVLGRLGLLLAENQENATLVWAPTGLSLAALVLGGRRLWPAVFAGALAVNLWIGTPLAPALGIACGNTLEVVLGAYLLTRVGKLDPAFGRLRDVLIFILFGALVCTPVSATCGVGSLWLADRIGTTPVATVWLDWWLGDAGGAIVVAPAILVWARGEPPLRALARRVETWVVLALLAIVAVAGFAGLLAGDWRLLAALMVFPLLVWAGLRLGPRGAIILSAEVSLIAVIGGSQGGGPFAGAASLYLTLAYIATTGMIAVILAAAVAERDAAEHRRRAGDEERARLELQASERQRLEELGMLAGGVAHDFNNLLVPILASAELLERSKLVDTDRARRLRDIATAARRAGELCHQLLTYAGHATPASDVLDLGRLTHEMRRLLEASTARRVSLVESLEDGVVVRGDAAQLRQLVMNLILNATEACAEGGGTVRMRVASNEVSAADLAADQVASDLPAGRYAVLEVADDGVGMDPASVRRIFRPFYSTKFTGRGLGLAAVLGAVRAHGGAIVVDTAPGEGSRFRVFLPLHDAAAEAVPEGPAPEPVAALPRATALVADDDAQVLDALVAILETLGIEAITAADGAAAVEQFSRHAREIDFVVLDVLMPRLDGKRALEAIRAEHRDVPAILVSGYSPDELVDVLDETTVFLQKPFTLEQLQSVASTLLASRATPRPTNAQVSAR